MGDAAGDGDPQLRMVRGGLAAAEGDPPPSLPCPLPPTASWPPSPCRPQREKAGGARADGASPGAQWFDSIDTNHNGQLDVRELQKALSMGNMTFSLATVSQIMRVYDASGTGCISFAEFGRLHRRLTKLCQLFKKFDPESKGVLALDSVKRAIAELGHQLDDTPFYSCCKSFDPDRSAKLALQQFVAMAFFLDGGKAVFAAYDKNKTGSITVNFSQFVYACSQTR